MVARRKDSVPVDVSVVKLRILVSFNGLRAGDLGYTDLDDQVQGWINAGLAEVVETHEVSMELEVTYGEDPAGPGEPEPDVQVDGEA